MFRSAALVFKQGALVVRDGEPTRHIFGRALAVEPGRDAAIDRRLKAYYADRYGISDDLIKVPDHAVGRPEPFELVSCAH
jgi:formylmethanofuran dehydrogenase subunit A